MVFTGRVTAQPAPGPEHSEPAVVSGEAVEVDVRVARVGSRAVALLLDVLAQAGLFVVLTPVALLTVEATVSTDGAVTQGVILACLIVVLVGYPVAFETLTGGRTLGKLALGLRVVRDDGGPIQFRHALTRRMVAVAAEWPGLVLPPFTWLASLVTTLAHPRGKRLGDLAAGTIVIHERTPAAWGWVPGMPPPLAGWATSLDLTTLDDELALAVRHFLARGHDLVEPERSRLGQSLAAEVAAVTTPPPPPGVPGWAYLAAVLAERHRRAAHRLVRARASAAALWPELTSVTRYAAGGGRPPVRPAPAVRTPAPAPTPMVGPVAPAPGPVPASVSPVAWAGQAWPSHAWPEPPWRAPRGGDQGEDWTGLRPPRVASALRSGDH